MQVRKLFLTGHVKLNSESLNCFSPFIRSTFVMGGAFNSRVVGRMGSPCLQCVTDMAHFVPVCHWHGSFSTSVSLTWLILYQCVTDMAHFVPLSLTWLILYQCVTDMARTLRFYLIITIMNLYELLSNIDSPRDDCLNIYMYIITYFCSLFCGPVFIWPFAFSV